MRLSKMEWIALIIVFFVGLHFFNKYKMENEPIESSFGTTHYDLEEKAPVIVAFGDSLTLGTGVKESESYPAQLSKMLGVPVINAGAYGETTSQALTRLPHVLHRYKPDIVILEGGMNDILHKRERSVIKENLKKMVETIQKSGAKVVVLGIPDMDLIELMIASDINLYEEVARETGALYIPDVFGRVLKDEALKKDYALPNAEGYRIVAKKIYEELREFIL